MAHQRRHGQLKRQLNSASETILHGALALAYQHQSWHNGSYQRQQRMYRIALRGWLLAKNNGGAYETGNLKQHDNV